MPLRKGHGRGRGVPRIEVSRANELPAPLPAVPAVPERRENGQIADSASAKALGALGGHAKATKKRLLQGLGLAKLADQPEFQPYYRAAQAWLDHQAVAYASMSGGYLGPGPYAMLGNAALMLAASRYLFDNGFGDVQLMREASMQADRMKQQQLAAYELAVKEGQSRAALADGAPAFDDLLAAVSEAAEEPVTESTSAEAPEDS